MAKKKKKAPQTKSTSASSKKQAVSTPQPSTTVKMSRPAKKTGTVRRRVSIEQFRQEYAYVLKDLRTIFILAAIMFALLIAINLIAQ